MNINNMFTDALKGIGYYDIIDRKKGYNPSYWSPTKFYNDERLLTVQVWTFDNWTEVNIKLYDHQSHTFLEEHQLLSIRQHESTLPLEYWIHAYQEIKVMTEYLEQKYKLEVK